MKKLSVAAASLMLMTAGCQGVSPETRSIEAQSGMTQDRMGTPSSGTRVRVTTKTIEEARATAVHDVPYAGNSSCGKMNLTINFKLDAKAGLLRDFLAAHYCSVDELNGGLIWKAPTTIPVSQDGKFSYHDTNGNSIQGIIAASRVASGEVNPPPFLITCKDGQSYQGCTKWSAAASPDR